jgi:hypothetical protein
MVLAAAVAAAGCMPVPVRTPRLHPPDAVPSPVDAKDELKLHLRSGDLVVLREWRLTGEGTRVEGTGQRYSASRARVGGLASHVVPIESVALVETHSEEHVYPFAAQSLTVLTVFWGAISGLCVADPKSCFGSCPTFYWEGGSSERPEAEGFSASIAKILEERDVDALAAVRPERGRVVLRMRNEALETHSVQRVRLLAAPRPRGGRVLATPDGRFLAALDLEPPVGCSAGAEDCLATVRAADDLERASAADATDLAAREHIVLEFPRSQGELGLVIGARQSLLTTFLFYQTMAYAGSRGGELLARLETGTKHEAERALGMARLLGGIEAEVARGDGSWQAVGAFRETGPIAADTQVLPFHAPDGSGPLRVRLRLAKGNWRLGHVALARLAGERTPETVELRSVERNGHEDAHALGALRDADRHLVTLPGDEYRLVFDLPKAFADPELFLESQGYYYEWQRAEWLREEDAAMTALVLARPDEALRLLAGPFKAREGEMERAFWQSRFRR